MPLNQTKQDSFGEDLPSQIISIPNREGYFRQNNFLDCQKDKQEFTCGGRQVGGILKMFSN